MKSSSMTRSATSTIGIQNHVLSLLGAEQPHNLLTALEPITLPLGRVIYDAGQRLENFYFPTSCVVSFLYTMRDGCTAEVGITGNDGVVGVALLLGNDCSNNRAVVQIAGNAFRVSASILRREFAANPVARDILLRYALAFITQISQTAVCNRLHSMEQRLCRWLLLCHDRIQSPQLRMTQEYIANMLGGRRETVAVAAGRLQDAGLIDYSRGNISIVDRKGLEAAVCECYEALERETRRIMATGSRSSG
jgi:CRP-like cAMP-binding protein